VEIGAVTYGDTVVIANQGPLLTTDFWKGRRVRDPEYNLNDSFQKSLIFYRPHLRHFHFYHLINGTSNSFPFSRFRDCKIFLFLFTQACREGDLVVLSSLLENNVSDLDEPNAYGLSLLHYAARNDQGQVIQMLIDRGAGKNIEGAISRKFRHFCSYQMVIKVSEVL